MAYRTAISTFILVLSFVASPAIAGQVYGTVLNDSGPVVNATVSVSCSGASGARQTDGAGSYSVYVNGSGVCTISVNGANLQIRVYDDDVRYDLHLSGQTLRRR